MPAKPKAEKNVGGRPKSANPRVFFACRLPKETVDKIKEIAKDLSESEANVVVRAVEVLANPIMEVVGNPPAVKPIENPEPAKGWPPAVLRDRVRKTILKPGGKVL